MKQPELGKRLYGVDIGNSGLRIVQLNVAQQSLGPAKRVNWEFDFQERDQQTRGEADKRASNRFIPASRDWLSLLGEELNPQTATRWLVSSVRRDAYEVLSEAIAENPNHTLHRVVFKDLPLIVATDAPQRVGIDRLLAALAAAEALRAKDASFQGAFIVIQAGSAVTVDLGFCDPSHVRFEGGAILPGLPMMVRLLGTAADMLPRMDAQDLTELPPIPGKNTEEAMLCGSASALVGGVIHLVGRYRSQLGSQVPVILSGGDGSRLTPYLSEPLLVAPDLVQHGLLILATLSESD